MIFTVLARSITLQPPAWVDPPYFILFVYIWRYNTKCNVYIVTILMEQCNGTKYIHNVFVTTTMSHFQKFSSSQVETLYLLNSNSPFPFLATLGYFHPTLLAYSRYLVPVEPYYICCFMSC